MILDIRCRNFLTWRFEVLEVGALVADIDLKMLKDGADIQIKGEPFRMYREGFMSGAFILEAYRTVLVRAEKPSAFKRRFEITFAGRRFVLAAVDIFRRAFVLSEEPADGISVEVGRIEPLKWYNHNAVAKFDDDLPIATDVFIVALVLMLWKRAAGQKS